MDSVGLRTLEAEVKAQMANINQVYELLRQRTAEMSDEAPAYVESAAYQLHNLYSSSRSASSKIQNEPGN